MLEGAPLPLFYHDGPYSDSTTRCYRSTFIGNSVGGSDAFARGGAIYCTNTQSILTRFNVGRRVCHLRREKCVTICTDVPPPPPSF